MSAILELIEYFGGAVPAVPALENTRGQPEPAPALTVPAVPAVPGAKRKVEVARKVLTFPAPRRTRAAWTVRAGGKVFSLVLLGGCTASEALAEIRTRWPDGELID